MSLVRWVLERLMPWYSAAHERYRDERTERVSRMSAVARARAARVITAYRLADDERRKAGQRARVAGENLIDEIER